MPRQSTEKAQVSKAPRGRPSLKLAAEIDERILSTASRCFLAHGYAKTTFQMIADEASITKPTLYQRYPDKEALLRAVVHQTVESWSTVSARRDVDRGQTLDARLRHYGRTMIYWSQQPHIRAFGRLIRECQGSAPKVAAEVDAIRTTRMLNKITSEIIKFGAADGYTIENPKLLADIFYAMIGVRLQPENNVHFSSGDAEIFVDHVVDILMNGSAAWSKVDKMKSTSKSPAIS